MRDSDRDNPDAEPATDDPAAVVRVRDAWRSLAPAGKYLNARRAELVSVFEHVLARDGLDKAYQAWIPIHLHVSEARLAAPMITRARRENDGLVKDAAGARKRLRQALGEAVRLHNDAAKHKWYGDFGVTGVKEYTARRWNTARAVYVIALETIDRDPLFRFLLNQPFMAAPEGNPTIRRNGRLRAELKTVGLTRREVVTVLSAIGFTSGR